MAGCTRCNICDTPGTLGNALERQSVPCNVRAFKENAFTVWRCSGCRSLHCAEDADLNYYYSNYPPHRVDPNQLSFITRIGCRNQLRMLTRQGVKKSDRILDYGCGGGMFLDFLQEQGYTNAYGYDSYVPAHADRNLLDRRYDAIVSWDVIEHDEDPRGFVRTLSSLLSPKGLLVVGTPNATHIPLTTPKPVCIPELHQPYHRHILSEEALLRLGHENGLTPAQRLHRFYMDSPYPFINTRFIWAYIAVLGGYLDALGGFIDSEGKGDSPRLDILFRSPDLLWKAFFGYFFPGNTNMIVSFRSN
jgi:SAM-dependent methyltransferase